MVYIGIGIMFVLCAVAFDIFIGGNYVSSIIRAFKDKE